MHEAVAVEVPEDQFAAILRREVVALVDAEAAMRVAAAGLCRTDWHVMQVRVAARNGLPSRTSGRRAVSTPMRSRITSRRCVLPSGYVNNRVVRPTAAFSLHHANTSRATSAPSGNAIFFPAACSFV